MNKIKIIALFGKSGAGKDTIKKELLNVLDNSTGIINNTTRPKREYEIDGVDYNFISVKEFTKKILNNEMVEAACFNNWFYGTSIESLSKEKINIGVFSPQGINCLWSDSRLQILPIYIDVSDKTRLLRQLNREENPNCTEICRRFSTDEKDFQDDKYDFDYCSFNNENNNINLENILHIIENNGFEIGND